jgi:hypothetical protein
LRAKLARVDVHGLFLSGAGGRRVMGWSQFLGSKCPAWATRLQKARCADT